MMVEATPPAPFVMAEPDLLLELLIIALDAPPQLGGVDQIAERDVTRQGREPVLGRRILALGPLDQQPLLGRFSWTFMARCHVNAHRCKPRGQPLIGAFPPFDGAPRSRPQGKREVLDPGTIGRVAAPFLRRPAGPHARLPYQALRLYPGHLGPSPFPNPRPHLVIPPSHPTHPHP